MQAVRSTVAAVDRQIACLRQHTTTTDNNATQVWYARLLWRSGLRPQADGEIESCLIVSDDVRSKRLNALDGQQ